MIPGRVLAALAVGFLAYTGVDILIWQRFLEGQHGAVSFQQEYHAGYALVLAGLILNGVILIGRRWWALWYAGAFFTLAMSGLEDALYYVLSGKSIPAALPWLDGNPLIPFHPVTSATLLASVTLWLGLWLTSLVVIRAANSAGVVSARDRLATTIRILRLAGIALVLALVVGGSWTLMRPAEVPTGAAATGSAVRDFVGIQLAGCGTDWTIVSEPNGVVLNVTVTSAGAGALAVEPSQCAPRGSLDTRTSR